MKLTEVLLVVVVTVHSVSTDQTKVAAGRENAAAPSKPKDLYTVLREMMASINELKVDVLLLKRENREQTAKLKEVEGLKVEVDSQRTDVDKLKKQLRALRAKLKELEGQNVDVEAQKKEVDKLKKELENQKKELDKVKQQQQGHKVAFSASLNAEGNLGPFPSYTPLVYKRVLTNVGNAYNPNTGVFTAPLSGVYEFQWHMGVHDSVTAATLFRNGQHIYCAYENQSVGFGTSSQGAVLLLQPGDTVVIKLMPRTKAFDSYNHHTTFSGQLLFTM